MRKGKVHVFFMFGFLLCMSCKSNIPTASISNENSSKQEWRTDKLFDPVWYDSLQSQRKVMMLSWLKDMNPLKDFSEPRYSEAYNLFTSQEDWKGSEQIPLEIFTLDPQAFKNAQIDTSVAFESLLKLNKDKAEFDVVKDNKFYYNVSMSLINHSWKFNGYGPIFKNFADSLSILHFKKHVKIFRVYLIQAFEGYPFTVYKKDGTLYCLIYGGGSKVFEEELKRLIW